MHQEEYDSEQGMREAALRDGSKVMSKLLSEIPDSSSGSVQCPKCNNSMNNLGRKEKDIISLLLFSKR